ALGAGATPTIVDGDTVRIAGVSIRLTDYDAPELFSPRCPQERALAQRAANQLRTYTNMKLELELVPCATSNYGRLCARASINGEPLAAKMIAQGLGAPYVCGQARALHRATARVTATRPAPGEPRVAHGHLLSPHCRLPRADGRPPPEYA